MKSILQTIGLIVGIFILAVAFDQITPLKQLTAYLAEHPEPYRGITIGLAVIGWLLLIVAFGGGIWSQGRPMTDDEAQEFMSTSAGNPRIKRKMWGKGVGREFRGTATFREIKDTIRTGVWLHGSSWWPILIGLVGLPFAAYGMFGFFVVIGPPLVKVICAGALLYATIRTVWGFWKA